MKKYNQSKPVLVCKHKRRHVTGVLYSPIPVLRRQDTLKFQKNKRFSMFLLNFAFFYYKTIGL